MSNFFMALLKVNSSNAKYKFKNMIIKDKNKLKYLYMCIYRYVILTNCWHDNSINSKLKKQICMVVYKT